MTTATTAWDVAARVTDPEIPVISIADLGILRDVAVDGDRVTITITPTYSGCPAMKAIEDDLHRVFTAEGCTYVRVLTKLSPAWTTDWMTDDGKRALEEFGIAPPSPVRSGPIALTLGVACPRCRSLDTGVLSRFGSTSCKALYRCNDCGEPFDWFKPL